MKLARIHFIICKFSFLENPYRYNYFIIYRLFNIAFGNNVSLPSTKRFVYMLMCISKFAPQTVTSTGFCKLVPIFKFSKPIDASISIYSTANKV